MRFIWTAIGLVVAGVLAIWLIKAVIGLVISLLTLVFYVAVGAILVGGAIYVYGRAKRSITGQPRRRLPY
jgi:hypothetical protein